MSSHSLKCLLKRCQHYCRGWQQQTVKNINQHRQQFEQMTTQGEAGPGMNLPDGFLQIGEYNVFSWSISGIETSVVVRKPSNGFNCCFDMGHSCRSNVKCQSVLISHSHMDHISAVPQHIKKRELYNSKPATYFVPEHVVEKLHKLCLHYAALCENSPALEKPKIRGVSPGERIKLSKGHYAVPFPTVHRVKSQGYIVYSEQKQLKPEFQGLSSSDIGARVQKGEIIHGEPIVTPEIAFTGDTTFQVFTDEVYTPPADLFKVKLLIVEATYIDDDRDIADRIEQARQWGHIHLSEIYENAALFKNVDNILLMHLSDKYSCEFIEKKVFENIPEELKGKIHVSTLAKARYL